MSAFSVFMPVAAAAATPATPLAVFAWANGLRRFLGCTVRNFYRCLSTR